MSATGRIEFARASFASASRRRLLKPGPAHDEESSRSLILNPKVLFRCILAPENAVPPVLDSGGEAGRGSAGGRYGVLVAAQSVSFAPAFRLAHVPAENSMAAPVTIQVMRVPAGIGTRGFHAMDEFGSPVAAPSAAGDSGVSSGIGR